MMINLRINTKKRLYNITLPVYFFFPVALRPSAGHGLLILEVSRSHTHNDASQSVGLLWTSDQLVAETSSLQHSQQTNIHAPSGIRTHDLSRRAAADLRLRPRGHWDRLSIFLLHFCVGSVQTTSTVNKNRSSFTKQRLYYITVNYPIQGIIR